MQSAGGINDGAYKPGRGSTNATRGAHSSKHVAQRNAAAGGTARRSFDPRSFCCYCNMSGHWTADCRKLQAANAAAAAQARGENVAQGAQVFSSIDLQSAYYQVKLKPLAARRRSQNCIYYTYGCLNSGVVLWLDQCTWDLPENHE